MATRWSSWNTGGALTMRRHGWPEICDGSGCEPVESTVGRTRSDAEERVG